MKSRSNELLDRSIGAMVSAIEVYNKPDFLYREETFSILAINSWELFLKSKWLKENENKINSLYVYENAVKKNGEKSKKRVIKKTRSGSHFTHSIDNLAKKLIEKGFLNKTVWMNIQLLLEIRDSSIHFYSCSEIFSLRLQEIGIATLKNYVSIARDWFGEKLSKYNFYLMPISFFAIPSSMDSIILNKEERNFIEYVEKIEADQDNSSEDFSITVNIDVKFTRSKAKEALGVRVTNNQDATEIRLTEEQIRETYPWDYQRLTKECQERYSDFKVVQKYHDLRKGLLGNEKHCKTRRLDPNNPSSSKKDFYSPGILRELDKHYQRK